MRQGLFLGGGGMGGVARHPRDISKIAGTCCDTVCATGVTAMVCHLVSCLPPLLATPLPRLFLAPFRPFPPLLFCRARGMAQSLERGSFRVDLSTNVGKELPAYEQRRVDLATFRALLAGTWGHCPQVLCFTIVWDTLKRKKLPNGLLPPPAF